MPSAPTLATTTVRFRALLDELEAHAAREAAFRALLDRCRLMCREDGVSLGEIAATLAAEIDAALG